MLILLRRLLVIVALMFWQGGFTFYASVVVPIGQEEFGHETQGIITRQVTVWLNRARLAAIAVLAWDLVAARAPSKARPSRRCLCWLVLAATLAYLFCA